MTRDEAQDALNGGDLLRLGLQADRIRQQLHPEHVITYSNEPAGPTVFTVTYNPADTSKYVRLLESVPLGTDAVLALPDGATAVEFLRALAITRIYLHGITHVQVCPDRCGQKICQIALRFGANDIAGWSRDRTGFSMQDEELRRIIRDAGFVPKERDPLFRLWYLD